MNQSIVRGIIARARREPSNVLNLSGYRLHSPCREVPDEVFVLPQLATLDRTANDIREVPEWIGDLANLFVFVVAHNRVIPRQYMESSGVPNVPAFVYLFFFFPHRLLVRGSDMTLTQAHHTMYPT